MQAMQFGNNRGFGGPPQPQRQGGRRGMRGGGGGGGGGGGSFRGNSRFDNSNNQRNSNQNQNDQGGQRPNEKFPPTKSPQQPQTQPAAKTAQPATPVQPAQKKVESPAPQAQAKPAQTTPVKPAVSQPAQDKVDNATPEQKTTPTASSTPQNAQAPNINGTLMALAGANKQGGWQSHNKQGGGFGGNKPGGQQGGAFGQGGPGNKPGGPGQQGGTFGQGGQGNKQGGPGQQGGTFGQGGQGNKQGGGGLGQQGGTFGQGGQANKPGGTGPQGGNFGGQANKQGGGGLGQQGGGGLGQQGGGGLGQGGNFGQADSENKQGEGHHGGKFGGPGNKFGGHQGGNFGQGDAENKQGEGHQGGKFGGPGNKFGGHQGGNRPFMHRGGNQGGEQGGHGGHGGPPRNQMGKRWMDRSQMGEGGRPVQREEHMLANKLKDLVGPLVDLAPIDQSEVKFNGRSRLYIGNLTNDITEEEIQTMFKEFGETAELFLNKEKNFGFIKMDYRVNAERAKRELDGKMRNGRTLRVRFAPHNSAIRVKNLPPFVSNELLYRAFEIFGKIERAYVKVDERGKTLGEGVVEFARKPSALAALRNCTEKCFFLTSSLRPVIVENFEEPDEFDGYPEKNLPKKHPEFLRAREVGPRFSELSSFEHEYGTRWKQLHELHRQKEEALKKELASEEEKLEAQMEYAKYEHETELLREQLRQREQDRERQKRSWEQAERAADERREAERAALLRQEEELASRMRQQDDELRRRQQENTLFVQAQRLNSMLDRQEQGMFDQQQPMDGGFRDQYDMGRSGYEEGSTGRGWEGPRTLDDYPNKRRRF